MRKIFKRLIVFTMFATVLIPGLAFAAGNETSSTSRVVNTVEKTEQPTRREIRKQTKQIADSDKPSLAGCQFGVYSDEDATNLLDTVEIKEVSPGVYEGVNKSGETLPAGKVYVKEIKAAKGYLLNKNVYPVTIKAGETIPLTIPNDLDIAEPVLNKTSDIQKVRIGSTVKYTITMTNPSSTGTVYNAVLEDSLSAGDSAHIVADSVKANIDGTNFTDFTSTESSITSSPVKLGPGQVLTMTYNVKVTKNLPNGVLKNALSKTHLPGQVFNVTTSVENGTIDPSKVDLAMNSNATINYQPKDGYRLSKVYVDGAEVNKDNFTSSYTFSNIDQDHRIHVVYEPNPNVEQPVKTFDKQSYHKGETVKNEILVNQSGKEGSTARNVVVTDKNTSTLKINADTIRAEIVGSNGSSQPKVSIVSAENGEFTVTVDELKGGDKIKVTFDGEALNTAEKITNTATVTSEGRTQSVTAEAASVYKIKTKVTNGTIDPNVDSIPHNSDKTINYQPKDGYQLKKIVVDGKDVDITTAPSNYTFSKITGDHEIEVIYKGINKPSINKQFDKKEYSIGETIKNIINFKNDGNADAKVKDATVSDTPGNGVKINTDTIKVNYNGLGKYVINIVDKVTGAFNVVFDFFTGGEEATITYDSVIEKNVETIENTASAEGVGISKIDTKAVATPKYTITTEVVNGNISPNQEVVRGGDSKIEYTPKDGYKLKKITVDGNEVEKSKFDKEYNFTKVNDNHKIKVEYEGIPHPTIKKTFDKETYKVGDTIKATVEVAETGHPSSVSHNVVVADANQTGFKIKTDTIKATVSKSTERKDVDEKPQVEVVDAEKGTFNVKLASLDSTQKLTITYDMEITRESGSIKNKATLKTTEYPNEVPSEATGKLTFDIGTKVTGGKITPPVNDVPFGSNTKIEYTPDENHYLDKILIDGKEVKKDKIEKSYTFEKIENNHNIEVIYKKVPTPTIEKKSDKKDYIKGDIAKYTVKVTNGDSEAENVVLTDIFEKEKIDNKVIELDKSSIKINGESVPYADKYTVAKLAPKAEVVLTYEAKILEDGDNTVKNDASVIAKGMTKEIVTENVINTHEIPKLDVDKTSDKKSYRKNETIKYSVKITNNGKFAAHNLKVKDFITKGSDYVKLNNDFAIDGKEAKSLEIEKLEPGKTVEITYSGKVMKDVSDQVTNKVIVEADYMEMEKDGNGKLVPKNPPSAENTVEIEKTPTPENIKTGDAQNVLTYVALGMSALLATLIIAGRKLKKN